MSRPWTMEELKDLMVEYQKTKPRILDEAEYRTMLDTSVIHNFRVASDHLNHTRKVLNDVLAGNKASQAEIQTAIDSLSDAEFHFQKGSMVWNKVGGSHGQLQRSILWFDPPN